MGGCRASSGMEEWVEGRSGGEGVGKSGKGKAEGGRKEMRERSREVEGG